MKQQGTCEACDKHDTEGSKPEKGDQTNPKDSCALKKTDVSEKSEDSSETGLKDSDRIASKATPDAENQSNPTDTDRVALDDWKAEKLKQREQKLMEDRARIDKEMTDEVRLIHQQDHLIVVKFSGYF